MTLFLALSWQHFWVSLFKFSMLHNVNSLNKFYCVVDWLFLFCFVFVEKSTRMSPPQFVLTIVGPCALEYTKLKTSDHFWTDPSANELVQRHKIHGAHRGQEASPSRRPALGVREQHEGCGWVEGCSHNMT